MVRATANWCVRLVGGAPESSSDTCGVGRLRFRRRWTTLGMGFPTAVAPRCSTDRNSTKSEKVGRESGEWRHVR
jgi:hypothetical protein